MNDSVELFHCPRRPMPPVSQSRQKDLNVSNRSGKTPVMVAAEYKLTDLMSYFLDQHVDLKAETNHGWTVCTPCHVVSMAGLCGIRLDSLPRRYSTTSNHGCACGLSARRCACGTWRVRVRLLCPSHVCPVPRGVT